MGHYKKFVKDIGLIGIANLLNNFKSLLIIPLLTKGLYPADYGIWVQFRITLLLLAPFVALGIQNSVVRFLAGQKDKRSIRENFYSDLFMVLFSGGGAGLLFYVFSDIFSLWIFRSIDYGVVIKIFSAILVFESLNLLLLEYFKAFRYIGIYFLTMLFETICELGLIAYSILNGYGIIGVFVSFLVTRGIFMLVRCWYVFKEIGFALPKFKNLKRDIAFGLPLTFSAAFFFVVNSGDKYVINYFLGLGEVSLYSVAYSLAYIVVLATAPICYILYPALVAFCNNKDYDEALVYVRYSTKYLLIIGISVAIGILTLSKQLILLFSTKEFIVTATFMPLLVVGLLIFQTGVISQYIVMVFNRTKQIMLLHLILAIANICLNIIAVPYLGIAGAALVTLITFVAFSVFNIVYSQRFLKHTLDFPLIGKCITAAIIMSIVVAFFKTYLLFNIFFSAIASAIIYLLVLYFLKVIDYKEWIFFKNIFWDSEAKTKLRDL